MPLASMLTWRKVAWRPVSEFAAHWPARANVQSLQNFHQFSRQFVTLSGPDLRGCGKSRLAVSGDWLDAHCPVTNDGGPRKGRCDAWNFHICLKAVEEANALPA
jgi:hypothetical protein